MMVVSGALIGIGYGSRRQFFRRRLSVQWNRIKSVSNLFFNVMDAGS